MTTKKILIIDEDKTTLSMLSDGLATFDELEILTAEKVKLAAQLLNILKIDLVITEIQLPDVDGFKFLAYLKKKYSKIPIIVVTGHGSAQVKARVNALGISHYFDKPPDMEILSKRIWEELDISTEGRIYGINLASFLQLIDIEEKTCTLTIKSGIHVGYIYCLNGELIGAETGNLKGKKALYQILCWDKTKIQIEDVCRKMERQIQSPLMGLLMESQRLKDEGVFDVQEDEFPKEELSAESLFSDEEDVVMVPEQHLEQFSGAVESNDAESVITDSQASLEPTDTLDVSLRQVPNLFEYGIYEKENGLRDKTTKSKFIQQFQPEPYMETTANLGQLIDGGRIKYMIVKQRKGIRYALCPLDDKSIFMILGPGLPPATVMADLIKNLH